MKAIAVRRLGLVAAGAFLLLFLLQQAGGDGRRDARGNGLFPDFVSYYAVSQLLQEGRATEVYDQAEVMRRGKEILGLQSPEQNYLFLYPPFVLPLLRPLAAWPYPVLAWVFFGLNLALGWWLAHAVPRFWGWPEPSVRAAAAVFLCSLPWWRAVWFGQNSLVLLSLLFLGLRAWREGRPGWCGWYWALACYKPQLLGGLLLGGALLAGWRWRWGFFLGLMTWLELSTVEGWPRWNEWLSTLQLMSHSVENALWKHSFADTLRLWSVSGPTAMALSLSALLLASGGWWWKVGKRDKHDFYTLAPLMSCAAIGGLLLSPRLYQYDLILAYPFIFVAMTPQDWARHPRAALGFAAAGFCSDGFQAVGIPLWTLGLAALTVRLWRMSQIKVGAS